MKFSKNRKLNMLLNGILDDLKELGSEEVRHYMREFKNEPDYNIAQYGNLIIYYYDIRNFYKSCGYKTIEKWSDQKLWETYKRQVGYVARYFIAYCDDEEI